MPSGPCHNHCSVGRSQGVLPVIVGRRKFVRIMAAIAASFALRPTPSFAQNGSQKLATKKIPSAGVLLPIIGMGTWITFNVGNNQKLRDARTEVLGEFFRAGGGMVDSSPMYGSSEAVVGYGLAKLGDVKKLFSA